MRLYGPRGTALLAYTGWTAGVYGSGSAYRGHLKDSLAEDATGLRRWSAFGDLKHVRNDLLHHNGVASADHGGRCKVLKWFSPATEPQNRLVICSISSTSRRFPLGSAHVWIAVHVRVPHAAT